MPRIKVTISDRQGEIDSTEVDAINYDEALMYSNFNADQLNGIDEGVVTITIQTI